MRSGYGYSYFVTVSAYNFGAYTRQGRKVLLWIAKMSIPAEGESMTRLMPALIAGAAPLFGRETLGAKGITLPADLTEHVESGELKVIGEAPPPPAAP